MIWWVFDKWTGAPSWPQLIPSNKGLSLNLLFRNHSYSLQYLSVALSLPSSHSIPTNSSMQYSGSIDFTVTPSESYQPFPVFAVAEAKQ